MIAFVDAWEWKSGVESDVVFNVVRALEQVKLKDLDFAT